MPNQLRPNKLHAIAHSAALELCSDVIYSFFHVNSLDNCVGCVSESAENLISVHLIFDGE
jgi:hypothetical protein